MNEDENYSLVKGSVYRISSASPADAAVETEGVFLGYQQFGEESALAIRMTGKGKTESVRIIPCSAVLYIDVIRQEKEAKKQKAKPEKVEFYG